MLKGLLLKESLIDPGVLNQLCITKTETWNVAQVADYQPNVWTAISFEVDDAEAGAITEELSHALKSPGWYIDARQDDWVIVIFPNRVFKYLRGNQSGKAEAQAYTQAIGIPAGQIDWGE